MYAMYDHLIWVESGKEVNFVLKQQTSMNNFYFLTRYLQKWLSRNKFDFKFKIISRTNLFSWHRQINGSRRRRSYLLKEEHYITTFSLHFNIKKPIYYASLLAQSSDCASRLNVYGWACSALYKLIVWNQNEFDILMFMQANLCSAL